MFHRTRVACIAVVMVALAGCGDPNGPTKALQSPATVPAETLAPAITTAGTTGGKTAGTTVVSEAQTMSTTADTFGGTGPSFTDTVTNSSVGGPAVSAPMYSGDTVPPSTEVLGGVTINDPLPAQTDASDPATADVAVRYAFQHWILVDLDKNLRGVLVENGEDNVDNLDSRLKNIRNTIQNARFAVDAVTFTDATHADVGFRVQYNGAPSPYFPLPLHGTAIFQNGTWRISRQALCLLAFSIGQGCAGADTDNPVSPTTFQALSLPPGYRRQDGALGSADITVPGAANWVSPNGDTLAIVLQALAGVAKLSDADADLVLANENYRAVTGTPVEVEGHRGRLLVGDGFTLLVYIRADDVLVLIQASKLSANQITAVAGGVQPVA